MINIRQILLSVVITILVISMVFVALLKLGWKPFEIATILLSFFMFLLSLVTILFTFLSIKNQKQQWLNEAFIKNESEKLLEMRILLDESRDSLHFLSNILTPQKYAYVVSEAPILKRKDFVQHFNQVVKVNNLYNANQHIYRKHNLESFLESITLLLDSTQHLPDRDLLYVEVEVNDGIHTFLIEEWQNIMRSFNNLAHMLLDTPSNGKFFEMDELNEFIQRDQNVERERLLNIMQENIWQLPFLLDSLTLYVDSKKNDSLNIRRSKYYQNLK